MERHIIFSQEAEDCWALRNFGVECDFYFSSPSLYYLKQNLCIFKKHDFK